MATDDDVAVNGHDAAYDEEGEEEWDGEEYDEEEDADIEEHAAEIARRIEAQLLAQETPAAAAAAAAPPPPVVAAPPSCRRCSRLDTDSDYDGNRGTNTSPTHRDARRSRHSLHRAFAATEVPGHPNLLIIMHHIAASGRVANGTALAISRAVLAVAKLENLFGSLKKSQAPNAVLKRKRDGPGSEAAEPSAKRVHVDTSTHPLYTTLTTAVRNITASIPATRKLDAPLIVSIKSHLQAVCRFAESAAPSQVTPRTRDTLRDIGGFVKVIGVLGGMPTLTEDADAADTTVYPCMGDICRGSRFFAHPHGLRAHEHDVHKTPKPMAQVVLRCEGCDKIFRLPELASAHTEDAGRCHRARLLETTITVIPSVIVSATTDGPLPPMTEKEREEIEAAVVREAIASVLELHGLLQAHVTKVLSQPAAAAAVKEEEGAVTTAAS
ncbi:hypothetical protein MKEN_00737100 [Mycena kentingensis (nom. inval.)]|nr:hypothetical protein MKEN_00737100 [Mycena kentingensis (nom. inval.)]